MGCKIWALERMDGKGDREFALFTVTSLQCLYLAAEQDFVSLLHTTIALVHYSGQWMGSDWAGKNGRRALVEYPE
jgi:hypothetical protein